MKQIFIILFLSTTCTFSFSQFSSKQESGKMELLSPYFLFPENGKSSYSLDIDNAQGKLINEIKTDEGFTIKLTVDFKELEKDATILDIPEVINLRFRKMDPKLRDRQNYPAFPAKDGSIFVLESSITLNTSIEKPFRKVMTIGFPLAMLPELNGKHEVILNFTKAQFVMYVDGKIVDADFPIGFPDWSAERTWEINSEYVNTAKILFSAINPERDVSKKSNFKPEVQYWTPIWHNAWVGDVATIYYNGRYHVFYLFDRRHHSSKFGVGGHYFEHFSTKDFKTWTEHEAATPIEEQWETFGTGTPFVYDNKLILSYGLHTSRIYPDKWTLTSDLIDYYNNNGKTGFFKKDLGKKVPSGSTYSISKNGISHFEKTKNVFHYCENPSVFTDSNGKLMMFANFRSKGTWTSNSLDGDWYCINKNFPNGGDCTFYFKWGDYEYAIGGFVNLWKKIKSNNITEGWEDVVKEGTDFYNGVSVPSITEIDNGRFLMAGWIPIRGWGGPFIIHELVQLSNGRIGTKWMEELTPEAISSKKIANKIINETLFSVKEKSFLLTFTVNRINSQNGKLGVSFLSSNREDGCEFQIDIENAFAQYSNSTKEKFALREKSLRQGGAPHLVGNYAIENLIEINKPFLVRMLIKSNPKLGGTIIDSEIAGKRTMITYRADLDIQNLLFELEDVEITNLQLSEIN
ncbi:hypothetical protein DSECCO2_191530 [anaerobic digester metagenome]